MHIPRLNHRVLSASQAQLVSSPVFQFVSAFTVLYIVAILYLRHGSSSDPSSWFFDARNAYAHRYSTFRSKQAADYVKNASTAPSFKRMVAGTPDVCVGIPSFARNGTRYLSLTIGSLFEGLTQPERDRLHVLVLIAHTDPETHPAYREPWLTNLADDILSYDLPPEEFRHIADLEKDRGSFREKTLFDQIYVLKACYATGAELIVKFEDDVLAMDGWFHRMVKGTKLAAQQSAKSKRYGDYLYLRLFYTEEYFGWNSEEWRLYLSISLLVTMLFVACLTTLRSRIPSSRRRLTISVVVMSCTVVAPALILLFFAVGRVTLFPMPEGVNLMNNFGCCSQGQVFPRSKIPDLVEYLQRIRIGYIDTLTEAYADEHDELRWALTPSVIQHIGEKSTKDNEPPDTKYMSFGYSVSHKLWSFPFERYDPIKLHQEHVEELKSGTGG